MKRFILLFMLIFVLACNSLKDTYSFQPTSQFWKETENPQLIIDSIANADSLKIDNIKYWNKMEIFTSDSCIQSCHYVYNDSMKYSISIIEVDSNKYIVKYVYE